MMIKQLLILLFPALLSGCVAGINSPYQRPMLSVPVHWNSPLTGPAYLKRNEHWWENFADPTLSRLITRMLASNSDLAVAGLQLQQARVVSGLTNTNLTPKVTVNGEASNTQNLNEETKPTESYSTSLALSYELDLWGKLAYSREQAKWQVEATKQDRENIALTLIGNTAQYYWQIANLNQKISNQQAGLEVARKTMRLVEARYRSGAVGQLDLLQAQQSLLNRKNLCQTLQQQREDQRNALTQLFNRSPDIRQKERASLDTSQEVPIADILPVEVIARRPDVKAAEGRLKAALAGNHVARLNFYPTLSLSATLGAAGNLFSQWFTNPARTLGTSISLPFVEWNTVQLTIEKSSFDVQQAAMVFRNKVYRALSDVDNAMSQRLSYQLQRKNQLHNRQLSQQRLRIARSQYQAGGISFQALLDAEDALLTIENDLSDLQYGYLNSTMKLWLALGGGSNSTKNKEEKKL